jgi:hypothetical protein
MKRIRLMFAALAVVNEILLAMTDGVMSHIEMLTILKNAIRNFKLELAQAEVDKIQIISSKLEYDTLVFEDGDAAIYAPVEVLEKLKIDVFDPEKD